MLQFLHSLQVFIWGLVNNHPDWRDTETNVLGCISVIKHSFTGQNHYRLRLPRLYLNNTVQMEIDYLNETAIRGSGRCSK